MTATEAGLDLRLQPEELARIKQAAKATRESLRSFVVHAATAKADRVLARVDVTLMPVEEFGALLASLEMREHER